MRLQRTISAPPHEVYRAWLEPALLRQWMAPGLEVKRAEVDARVGGRFRIWHADAGTDVGGFECEIVELVPDQRLVFRWGFVGPERTAGPVYDSRLTITLRAATGNATTLTLVHERLDDLAAAMPDVADEGGDVAGRWSSRSSRCCSKAIDAEQQRRASTPDPPEIRRCAR